MINVNDFETPLSNTFAFYYMSIYGVVGYTDMQHSKSVWTNKNDEFIYE